MNTVLVRKIEPAVLKRLVWYNFLSAFFTIFFTVGCFIWMYREPGGEQLNQNFGNAMYAVSFFIGAIWALQTAYRSRYGPLTLPQRYQLAWLLIFLGLFFNGLGGLAYLYLQDMGATPFPSFADGPFLLSYPLFFVGLLLIPAQARFRTRMVIDATITTCSLLGISWYFIIGPQYFYLAPHATSPVQISNLISTLSYPILDVVSLLSLFLLVQRRMEKSFYIPYLLLAFAQICDMWANAAYAYLNVFGTYQTGNPYVDTFWFVGPLVCGIAGLYHYTTLVHEAYKKQNEEQIKPRTEIISTNPIESNWQTPSLHVYIPFVALLLLCIYADFFGNSPANDALMVLTTFVSIIVAARYLLATRENDLLLQERERQRRGSENLRLLVMQLNQILDMDKLLERIISLPITELGFTAAILLLFSQKEQEPFPMQVYAMSNKTQPVTWHIQENALLRKIAQASKEIKIHWPFHSSELPPDMRPWLQQQQLTASHFLPLYHQGRLLGCLGLTDTRTKVINQHMLMLGKAYCEQIATIIEHTRLYEEAREQEIFASAMTTIAARLNSAVVDPTEIGDLICQEGAKALRADYTILYLTNDQGLLEPCALSLRDGCKGRDLKDWPYIYPHEYEARALHISEPMLQQITRLEQPDTLPALETLSFPTIEKNGRKMSRQYPTTLRERLMQLRVHSTILTPLTVREKAAGILIFARAERDGANEYPSFKSTDLPLAQNFVEQARIAFTNSRLYQQLKTAHQKLQELDQLKDLFMITTSHELRTPLTAVQGYLELLASFSNEISQEQQHEFLQKARHGCDELVILLSNIMDASRLEMEAGLRPLPTSPVLVRDVIESTLVLIEPQLTREHREVHLHLPHQLAVMSDPVRLRQVLTNISTNALKYSDSQSPIGFFARANHEQGQVIISVADKGKGIAPKEQSRIFQRFYRIESDMNSPVRGSGLGLYVSQRLVEAMGGKIRVESRGIAGEGTTFHIQLPMAQSK